MLLKNRAAATLLLLFFSMAGYAFDFNLQVTVSHETCAGNGALSYNVSGAAATPAVNYKVIKLPNTTVADGTTTSVSGLQSGNYKVIATQTVNGVTQTDEETVTIENQVSSLNFTLEGSLEICGNDAVITATVTSGTPVTYEIVSGPVTAPPQASNVFTGLTAGSYLVKVTDACGNAPVVYYTLFSSQPQIEVSPATFPDEQMPDCDHVHITNSITSANGNPFSFPINGFYTIYPPDGSTPITIPVSIQGTSPSGEAAFYALIPFYINTPYNYTLTFTDACGDNHSYGPEEILGGLNGSLFFDNAACGKKATINVTGYSAPLMLDFTNYPEGFDPEALNEQYPGPYASGMAIIFGDDENPAPYGVYEVTITDACGQTRSIEAELAPPPDPVAVPVAQNTDCVNNLGYIEIITPPHQIVEITMTDAPDAYTGTIPQDVIGYVDGYDGFAMDGLPPGDYTFQMTNECGFVFPPLTVTVPEYFSSDVVSLQRPDCEPGLGSLMVGSTLSQAILTAAPAEYSQNLPIDMTAQISEDDGNLYLDAIPPGVYTFSVTNSCAGTVSKSVTVIGNTVTQNDYVYTPHCGSFDIAVSHVGTASASVQFWLQREQTPNNSVWVHPMTNVVYTDTPNNDNSYALINNTVNYSIVAPTGHYRIIKSFKSFSPDEISGVKTCTEIVYEFDYYNTLTILGVEALNCGGIQTDVAVNVEGVEPLTFIILEKDGVTENTSNGNSNIFSALDPATYKIQVTDPCGNDETFTFNVADLPPPVTAYTATGFETCDTDGDGVETFDISTLDTDVLNGQDTALVNLTYHTSVADANAGTNAIANNITTGSVTIYARCELIANPACFDISSFEITVYDYLELSMSDTQSGCEGEPNVITADAGYASYIWSTGEITQSISPTQAGTYTVVAMSADGCPATKSVVLNTSAAPQISNIDISDWTDRDNIITVYLSGAEGTQQSVQYSLDGINWQDSNVFTELLPGRYNVFVRDSFGCGYGEPFTTYLLTYPKFFTPNGDNHNETWRIKFSALAEPNLMVYIYDRYGKLITGFDTSHEGWDGTLNGTPLPSTDYWFVVKRQNGKEYRGHFAMIR